MKNKLLTISKIGLLAFTILVSQACQEDYEMVDPPMTVSYTHLTLPTNSRV